MSDEIADRPPPDDDAGVAERAAAERGEKSSFRLPKSERILNLIAYLLRANRPISVWEILDAVGGYQDLELKNSLLRRFERDKSLLRTIGVPIEFISTPEEEGYRIAREDYDLGEVVLPAGGAALLHRLLAAADHSARGLIQAHLRTALLKLGFDVNEKAEGTRESDASSLFELKLGEDASVSERLQLLSEAVISHRRVRLRYYTMGRDEENLREIDPYSLGYAGQAWLQGAWYLVGYCHLRQDRRIFKVSRIRGEITFTRPEAKAPDFEPPADLDFRRALTRTRWEMRDLAPPLRGEPPGKEALEAVVRFDAAVVQEVREMVPSAVVVEEREESTDLRFEVRARRPFLRFLLRFLGRARVLSPVSLEQELAAMAREVLAVIEGGDEA